MQDDRSGYHVDLENLDIRINGSYSDFLSAHTALVAYAKTRLIYADQGLMVAQQNYITALNIVKVLATSQNIDVADRYAAKSRLIEADFDLSVAVQNQLRAHQDFFRAQNYKNPYEPNPYEEMGFAPHQPLTALNLDGEG